VRNIQNITSRGGMYRISLWGEECTEYHFEGRNVQNITLRGGMCRISLWGEECAEYHFEGRNVQNITLRGGMCFLAQVIKESVALDGNLKFFAVGVR
jgi:hypothetical protein